MNDLKFLETVGFVVRDDEALLTVSCVDFCVHLTENPDAPYALLGHLTTYHKDKFSVLDAFSEELEFLQNRLATDFASTQRLLQNLSDQLDQVRKRRYQTTKAMIEVR